MGSEQDAQRKFIAQVLSPTSGAEDESPGRFRLRRAEDEMARKEFVGRSGQHSAIVLPKCPHLRQEDANPIMAQQEAHDLPLAAQPASAVADLVGPMLPVQQAWFIVVNHHAESADNQVGPPIVESNT
jgi:hypothetical protein